MLHLLMAHQWKWMEVGCYRSRIPFRQNSHKLLCTHWTQQSKSTNKHKMLQLSQLVVAKVPIVSEHLELVLVVLLRRIFFILKLPGFYEADERVKLSFSCTKYYWWKDQESQQALLIGVSDFWLFCLTVSYSRLSIMIIALASQFHDYLLWGQRLFSIVS